MRCDTVPGPVEFTPCLPALALVEVFGKAMPGHLHREPYLCASEQTGAVEVDWLHNLESLIVGWWS
jgi:hypothetical protein